MKRRKTNVTKIKDENFRFDLTFFIFLKEYMNIYLCILKIKCPYNDDLNLSKWV